MREDMRDVLIDLEAGEIDQDEALDRLVAVARQYGASGLGV